MEDNKTITDEEIEESISKYKNQETFINKYKFYKENQDKLRKFKSSNPLRINFEKASKELDDIEIKVRNGRTGVIHGTTTNEHFRLQENKNNAIKAIDEYHKLNEPLPKGSIEHGELIEYEVSQYSFETFESLRDGFLLERDSYHNEHGRNTYWQKRLNDSNSYLNGIKFKEVDLTDLVRCSMKADCVNIDFQLLYEDFTSKKIEPKDEFNLLPKISEQLFHERLAKVIPYILFIDFLEGLDKSEADHVEEEKKVEIVVEDEVNGIPCIEFDNLFNTVKNKNAVWGYMKTLNIIDNNGDYKMGSKRAYLLAFIVIMKKHLFINNVDDRPLSEIFSLKLFGEKKRIYRCNDKLKEEIVATLNRIEDKNAPTFTI